MNVKLSNGHVAEIQIHILGILEAKMENGLHELYDVMRGLDAVNEKGEEANANRLDR